MKKLLTLLSVLLFFTIHLSAQTPKHIVIEHFTNTYCSVCASNNPEFYATLHHLYPQVWHIAYHPSSPYSQCYFNNQNKAENDARTKFYGVYGATPRIALQGGVLPANYPEVSHADYDSALHRFAPFDVQVRMQMIAGDSVRVTTVVHTTGSHSYTSARLYAVVTEDSIPYSAHNGETVHYDVFRQQLYPTIGQTFTPAITIGDSVSFTTTFHIASIWVSSRLNVTAMIQEPFLTFMIQAGRATALSSSTTGIDDIVNESEFRLSPNPAKGTVFFHDSRTLHVSIYDMAGRYIGNSTVNGEMDISTLHAGIYLLRITGVAGETVSRRLVVME